MGKKKKADTSSICLLFITGKSLGFILCLYEGNISWFLLGSSEPTLNFTGKYQQNQAQSASKTIAVKVKISLCKYPTCSLVCFPITRHLYFLSTSILLLFVLFSYFLFLDNHFAVLIPLVSLVLSSVYFFSFPVPSRHNSVGFSPFLSASTEPEAAGN